MDITTQIQNTITERNTIRIAPHPALDKIAVETPYTPLIKQLHDHMLYTMISSDGVGLAAPQIGLSIRFIVVKLDNGESVGMLNPVITKFSKDGVVSPEGCLSVPGYSLPVTRYSMINVEYIDTDGNILSTWFSDREARIIQHEIDHLDGKTIIASTNITRNQRRLIISELKALKQINKRGS